MVDECLTLVLLIGLLVVAFSHASFSDSCDNLFSREWATVLKGVCCIVVILVHIPKEYSTKLQNLVGSFAYIAVTTFFFLSGYGVNISKNKREYMKHFWRNRVVSLFVPMALGNVLRLCVYRFFGAEASVFWSLLHVDGFVLMMSLCYAAFYVVYGLNIVKKYRVAGICGLTVCISIVTYILEKAIPFTVWPVPCLGFMYGVILAEYRDRVKAYLERCRLLDAKTWVLVFSTFLLGGGISKQRKSSLSVIMC